MFVSLQDEIVRLHVIRVLLVATAAFLKLPAGRMGRWPVNCLFNRAQRAAERRHVRMRLKSLKFDEHTSTSLEFTGRAE
jgi:hypothetical protein